MVFACVEIEGIRELKRTCRSGLNRSWEYYTNLVQKPVFLISSSRPSERHAVDTVGVDLFVIYRVRLCDFPPMSGHGWDGHALLGAQSGETFELESFSVKLFF